MESIISTAAPARTISKAAPAPDVMDGGDTSTLNYLAYRRSTAGVTVNLENHTASGGEAHRRQLRQLPEYRRQSP